MSSATIRPIMGEPIDPLAWEPILTAWVIGKIEVWIDRCDGGYRLPFPVRCSDIVNFSTPVWENADTGQRLAVAPTYWRPWRRRICSPMTSARWSKARKHDDLHALGRSRR
jgi:hypothetical protein